MFSMKINHEIISEAAAYNTYSTDISEVLYLQHHKWNSGACKTQLSSELSVFVPKSEKGIVGDSFMCI